jgi:hypothetical protein
MVHGRVEHRVQKRLSAMPTMAAFLLRCTGYAAIDHSFGKGVLQSAQSWNGNTRETDVNEMAKLRLGFMNWRDATARSHVRRLKADELVPISNALHALSKLFSGAGDHKRYYLNEFDLLKCECPHSPPHSPPPSLSLYSNLPEKTITPITRYRVLPPLQLSWKNLTAHTRTGYPPLKGRACIGCSKPQWCACPFLSTPPPPSLCRSPLPFSPS